MKRLYVALVILLAVGLLFPLTDIAKAESYPPLPEALSAMESDDNVTVETKKLPFALFNPEYFVFKPVGVAPTRGFVFYPGGLVDARAYAPSARAIAEAGYLVVIVSMPFDLAPFGWKRGNHILREFDSIKTWAFGGHSVGGAFICKYAKRYPKKVSGLVIWASTPSSAFRLDRMDIKVISIYGSNDGEAEDVLPDSAEFLPPGTPFVIIPGGNHTQCGYYDTAPDPVQDGDNPATISREEQQRQMLEATIDFLDKL
ncbi:MAG: alpha/beta hydrolase [Deltaproteobacteria bacterium]|nr:alpha/beta hydrolase [Deltaproteobacteria bacterium]